MSFPIKLLVSISQAITYASFYSLNYGSHLDTVSALSSSSSTSSFLSLPSSSSTVFFCARLLLHFVFTFLPFDKSTVAGS